MLLLIGVDFRLMRGVANSLPASVFWLLVFGAPENILRIFAVVVVVIFVIDPTVLRWR